MEVLALAVAGVREWWHALALGSFEKSMVKMVLVVAALYLIVFVAERIAGTRGTNYRSRAFFHDLAYWFYYRTGIHVVMYQAGIIAALEKPLSFVDVGLLTGLPFAAQALLVLVVGDFVAYWIHRAEHHFRFMWAFHTTHHSQEKPNFATIARFHPVEALYHTLLAYIPLRSLGVDPMAWLPMYLLVQLHVGIQHTQIPWRFGPFYKLIATPRFHSFHHSIDPAHHDKNFANMFSIWDHLFGTAVKDTEPVPTRFGLADQRSPSLLSSLITPFRLLHQYYILPVRGRRVGRF